MNSLRLGGTSVIAGVCADGPLIAADSRFVVKAKLRPDRPLAYLDGLRKVFALGPHLVATAGEVFVGPASFGRIVAEAARGRVPDKPIEALAYLLKARAPYLARDRAAANNEVIVVGFDGAHPAVCAFAPRQWGTEAQCGLDIVVVGFNAETGSFERRFHTLRAQAAARMMVRSITAFANSNPAVSGGAISVGLLQRPGRARWLAAAGRDIPDTLAEVVDAYTSRRLRFTLFPGVTQEELDAVARATPR